MLFRILLCCTFVSYTSGSIVIQLASRVSIKLTALEIYENQNPACPNNLSGALNFFIKFRFE